MLVGSSIKLSLRKENAMGVFDDIINAITGSGSHGSTDSKTPEYRESDSHASIRQHSVIVDHDNKCHDTIWSKTTVDLDTGQSKSEEGGHGPHFQK